MDKELEGTSSNFLGFSRDRVSLFDALQMFDIGRDQIKWEIINSLIKADMRSNLDTSGIDIIPKDVPGDVRNKA